MLRMDFTSQDYLRDPAAGLRKLRAAGPVVEVRFPIVGKTWITTTNDLAGRVLKDNETFTMRKNGKVAGVWVKSGVLDAAISKQGGIAQRLGCCVDLARCRRTRTRHAYLPLRK